MSCCCTVCPQPETYTYKTKEGLSQKIADGLPKKLAFDHEASRPKQVLMEQKVSEEPTEVVAAPTTIVQCKHKKCVNRCDCCKADDELASKEGAPLQTVADAITPGTTTTTTTSSSWLCCGANPPAAVPGTSQAAPAPKSSGGGFMASLGSVMSGNTDTDHGPYRHGLDVQAVTTAGAIYRGFDGVEFTIDMQSFDDALRKDCLWVSDRLQGQGCSPEIAKQFEDMRIDGDALARIGVEDIMREFDVAQFVAEGLYNKIWRILGVGMGKQLTTVEAVDWQPTSKSLNRIVQQQQAQVYMQALGQVHGAMVQPTVTQAEPKVVQEQVVSKSRKEMARHDDSDDESSEERRRRRRKKNRKNRKERSDVSSGDETDDSRGYRKSRRKDKKSRGSDTEKPSTGEGQVTPGNSQS